MEQVDSTLRVAMLVIAGVFAIAWLSTALAFRVSPKAPLSFCLANLGIGLGTVLVMQRAINPGFVSFQVADWLVIGGIASFRAGVTAIIGRKSVSRAALLLPLLAEVVLTIALPPDESSYFYRAVPFNVIACWVAAATAWDCIKGMGQEGFSLPTKMVVAFPFSAAGVLFGVRTTAVFLAMLASSDRNASKQGSFTLFLWTFVVILIVINIAITGLVVGKLLLRISELADKDALTRCLNRRALGERLGVEQERLNRSGVPLACALLDLDHFKLINDQYGHKVGDAALVHAVEVVMRAIRSIDVLGRYGGEEFVILMPNTSLEDGQEIAHRVRVLLAETPFLFEEQSISITASFGVAALETGEAGDRILNRADVAMYEAKRRGRNRVELAVASA
ncbi:MAG: GGDEF domain-containing protein [Rhodoferax sp.]